MHSVNESLEARPLEDELLAEWSALLEHRRQNGDRRVLDVADREGPDPFADEGRHREGERPGLDWPGPSDVLRKR